MELRAALVALARAEQRSAVGDDWEDADDAAAAVAEAAVQALRCADALPDAVAALEALALATDSTQRAATALDAGAATVVQRALAVHGSDARVSELARGVTASLLAAAGVGPRPPDAADDASDASYSPAASARGALGDRVLQSAKLFGAYSLSEANARSIADLFDGAARGGTSQRRPATSGRPATSVRTATSDRHLPSVQPQTTRARPADGPGRRPATSSAWESLRRQPSIPPITRSAFGASATFGASTTESSGSFAASYQLARETALQGTADLDALLKAPRTPGDGPGSAQKRAMTRRPPSTDAKGPRRTDTPARGVQRRRKPTYADEEEVGLKTSAKTRTPGLSPESHGDWPEAVLLNTAAVADFESMAASVERNVVDGAFDKWRAESAREAPQLTRIVGGPFADVDAELFLSAHAHAPPRARPGAVRLLERLFAPPAGILGMEQARSLAALDFTRREREAFAGARNPDAGGGAARGWSRALHALTESGGGLLRPQFAASSTCADFLRDEEDEAAYARLQRRDRADGKDTTAARARQLLLSATLKGRPATLAAAGVRLERGPLDHAQALKQADPHALLAVFRLVDSKRTRRVPRSVFVATLRVASGNALTEAELGNLADHYTSEFDSTNATLGLCARDPRLVRCGDNLFLEAAKVSLQGQGNPDVAAAQLGIAAGATAAPTNAPPLETMSSVLAADRVARRAGADQPLVDYELFCSSAKIGAAFGRASTEMLPTKPWLATQLRPESEARKRRRGDYARAVVTWDSHCKWFKEQRSGAFAYLVRRGTNALQHGRAQAETRRWLRGTAFRAQALQSISRAAGTAAKHTAAQTDASSYLRQRVHRVHVLGARQSDAQRLLAAKGRKARLTAGSQVHGATESKVFERAFMLRPAFEYLSRRGARAKELDSDLRAAHDGLASMGSAAKRASRLRFETADWLRKTSKRVVVALVQRLDASELLRLRAEKAHAQQPLRYSAFQLMRTQSKRAMGVSAERDASQRLLSATGRAAAAKKYIVAEAFESLHARGAAAVAHGVLQDGAKDYALKRVAGLRLWRHSVDEASEYMGRRGDHARATALAHHFALSFLKTAVEQAAQAQVRGRLAQLELRSLVQAQRDRVTMDRLEKSHAKIYSALLTDLTADRALLDVETLVKGAFGIYDADSSGSIDRVEFLEMMRGGNLLGVEPSRSELKDAFSQMDADGSGRCSFDEFYDWFVYKRNKAETKGQSKALLNDVVSPAERARRQMLVDYRAGKLKLHSKLHRVQKAVKYRRLPKGPPNDLRAETARPRSAPSVLDEIATSEAEAGELGHFFAQSETAKFRRRCLEKDADDAFGEAFLKLGRRVFAKVDADSDGALDAGEISRSTDDDEFFQFLADSGDAWLRSLLLPARLRAALADFEQGVMTSLEWDGALDRALAAKLQRRTERREARCAQAALDYAVYAKAYLARGRQIFELLDLDHNLLLTVEELQEGLQSKRVRHFLEQSGDSDLRGLLDQATFEDALALLDTDFDGSVSLSEWAHVIQARLRARLQDLAAQRELHDVDCEPVDESLGAKFLSLAARAFRILDVDVDAKVTRAEIVRAVAHEPGVVAFLATCGDSDLQSLCLPDRLTHALYALDSDGDGDVSADEWDSVVQSALEAKLQGRERQREEEWRRMIDGELRFDENDDADDVGQRPNAAQRPSTPATRPGTPAPDPGAETLQRRNAAGIPISNRESKLCVIS
ncbi:hypothetical protein M885DRAFT_584300 [Pelagophyceae sp. CCMP2097]|nr:hypothetical protein M885DRAFT_584300 [Pelagophyceae sp. CCMP2097]